MSKRQNKPVDPNTFVRAWQTAGSIEEVAQLTGMRLTSAQYRARIYRKKGIKLQVFPPRHGGPVIDIDALKKLAIDTAKPAVASAAKIAAKRVTRKVKKSRKKK